MSTLISFLKDEIGNQYPLTNKINTVGRSNNCHIILKHQSVSKEHALIEFEKSGQPILKDLGSLNGCFINGVRMVKDSIQPLSSGDVLQFGKDPVKLQFLTQAQTMTPSINTKIQSQIIQKNNQMNSQIPVVSPEQKIDRDRKISVLDFVQNDKLNQNFNQPINNQVATIQPQSANYQQSNLKSDQIVQDTRLLEKYELMKSEFDKQNQEISQQLMAKDESMLKLKKQFQEQIANNELLKEDNQKFKAKNQALELYASELQRKLDKINDDSLENRKMIEQVLSQDWGKKLNQNELELEKLRKILQQKDEELVYYRKQLASHFSSCKDYNHNYNSHLEFVEQQTKELNNAKKQISEYQSMQNESSRKWKNLLQENLDKDEKIKGLKLQIERQIENYQQTTQEYDKKINEFNLKLLKLLEDSDEQKFEAAQFLVQQMNIMQEEKKNVSVENENLHVQIQELITEIEKLKNDLVNYEQVLEIGDSTDLEQKLSQSNQKLKVKCEELEDVINDLKIKGGIPKIVQLQELLETLEKNLIQEKNKCKELTAQMKDKQKQNKVQGVDQENCIDFFSKVIDEKDKLIVSIQQEKDQCSKKLAIAQQEVESLQQKVMLTNNDQSQNNKNDYYKQLDNDQNGGLYNTNNNLKQSDVIQEKSSTASSKIIPPYQDYTAEIQAQFNKKY